MTINKNRIFLLQRNVRLISIQQCLTATAAMILPIKNSVWSEAGLSYQSVIMLEGIYALVVMLGEIPSGIFCDIIGYRRTLLIAEFLAFINFFIYAFANSFNSFLTAEIILAIMMCMESGAFEALIYDSLCELETQNDFHKIWGKIKSRSFMAMACASFLGGVLGEYISPHCVLLLIALCALGGFSIIFFTSEPTKSHLSFKFDEFVKICKFCFCKNYNLLWWLVFSGLSLAIGQAGFWLVQPYFIDVNNLSLKYIGIIFAFGHFVASIGSKLAVKLDNLSLYSKIGISVTLNASWYILLGLLLGTYSFIFFFLGQIARGFNTILFSSSINKIAIPKARATIISMSSFIYHLIFGVTALFTGSLADTYGIPTFFILIGIVALICGILMLFIKTFLSTKTLEYKEI